MKKEYTVTIYRSGRGSRTTTGTLEELIEYFAYTLEVGASWAFEKGNKKINQHPKTFASLITNLNNAERNRARNGYATTWYE